MLLILQGDQCSADAALDTALVAIAFNQAFDLIWVNPSEEALIRSKNKFAMLADAGLSDWHVLNTRSDRVDCSDIPLDATNIDEQKLTQMMHQASSILSF